MRSQKLNSLLVMFCLLVSISLTSCSLASGKTQPVMIVIEDWAHGLLEITDSLEIKVKGSSPLEVSDIKNSGKKNREMNGENQYGDNFGLLPDCEGWIRECGTFAGVKFDQVEALGFYGEDSFIQTELDINKEGKAVLNIAEGDRSAAWEFETTQDSNEPIYLKILITDYYVGVTQLEKGYLTFTSTLITEENPEKSYGFDEFIGLEEYLFQRPNKWFDLKAAYKEFSDARNTGITKTCEIFGRGCDGSASWSVIEEKYKSVYEEEISPMVENLILYSNSPDTDVRKSVLMLTQAADLLANCYFRVQISAQSENNSAYIAVSSCWQEVDQKISDLEIYLSEFDVQLNLVPRFGDF